MKFGLALGGGGTKGAYHLGVWQALNKIGMEIGGICGTSIGSLNGVLFAQGDFDVAVDVWKNISVSNILDIKDEEKLGDNLLDTKNILPVITEIYKNNGLKTEPLRNLILEKCDEERLRNSDIDFGLVTFSVDKLETVEIFKEDIPNGALADYLMASTSFPGFKSATIDDKKYIDGGVTNNIPVDMLLKKGYKNIISVDAGGMGVVRNNEAAGANIINIKCSENIIGHFDFSDKNIDNMTKLGYFDTLKAFDRVEGKFYCFNISDYHKKRIEYSKELLDGIEYAAKIFGIDNLKIYKIDEFIKAVVFEATRLINEYIENDKHNFFETFTDEKKKLIKITEHILNKDNNDNSIKLVEQLFSDISNAANSLAYFMIDELK